MLWETKINKFRLIDHQISLDNGEFGSREVDEGLATITPDENILSSTTFNNKQ